MNKQEFILLLTQSHVPTSEEYEKYRKEGLKRNLENFNVNDEYVTKKIKRFVEFHEKFSKDEVKEEYDELVVLPTDE